ncbi:YolD-like family protein [Lysinibacillus sp. YR326]|uniref:YolD-like family protein n=1 Tax=Lysinibacillus xylanilyticus TaxID=582475 RepID=UPI0010629770
MIKDRGSMKWTAMMLSEHLVEIRKWKEEQFYDKKRELTEWELEEIEQTIQLAF